jgi:hypothetical protein
VFGDLISKVVRSAVGEVAGTQEHPLVRSVLIWFGTLQGNLVHRWAAFAMSGVRCSLRPLDPQTQRFVVCGQAAIGPCKFCQQAVCLHHVMLSEMAEIVCFKCMADVEQFMRQRHAGATPAKAPDDEAVLRKKYLRVLGLKDPTTWDEVREEYRRLAHKHHPDRATTPAKREVATRKLVELNAAHEWLRARLEKAA